MEDFSSCPAGFLVSNRPFDGAARVDRFFVAKDAVAAQSSAASADGRVFLLMFGCCLDLDDIAAREADILDRLLADARSDAFFAALDRLNGRFMLLRRVGDAVDVVHDAGAQRAVVFHVARAGLWLRGAFARRSAAWTVASHSTLIARARGLRRAPAFDSMSLRFGLPGAQTAIEGVRMLPANFRLHPATGRCERYWPREARREIGVDAALAAFSRDVDAAACAIALRRRPAIATTAGLDSRTTLAAFARTPNARCFTHVVPNDERSRGDAQVARVLCAKIGLPHAAFTIKGRRRLEIADYNHITGLAGSYRTEFAADEIVVRSNLAEIGRCFWADLARRPPPQRPRLFVLRRDGTSADGRAYAAERFEEFWAMAGYRVGVDRALRGYDIWDLFYWEHRVSTWQGPLANAFDVCGGMANLFNARRLIATMLAVPESDRLEGALQRRYIATVAPALLRVPFNPDAAALGAGAETDRPCGATIPASSGTARE